MVHGTPRTPLGPSPPLSGWEVWRRGGRGRELPDRLAAATTTHLPEALLSVSGAQADLSAAVMASRPLISRVRLSMTARSLPPPPNLADPPCSASGRETPCTR